MLRAGHGANLFSMSFHDSHEVTVRPLQTVPVIEHSRLPMAETESTFGQAIFPVTGPVMTPITSIGPRCWLIAKVEVFAIGLRYLF